MIDRSIKVKEIHTPSKGRVICISDIHGNFKAYQGLLNKIDYHPNVDRLMLLGDLVEKGPQNLDVLHKIMNQVENENCHVLMGNCDFTCKNVLYSYRLDFLKHILLMRKNSIIHEMRKQIHLDFNENTNMEIFNQEIRKHFLKELCFINDLPHILVDDTTIYTHAAILNETTYGNDFREVMTTPFFLEKAQPFEKKVICGHLPVTEYCRHIASFDPIYDAKKNIYAIDGGNIVKKGGQLNALIFDRNKTSVDRFDLLPEVKVKKDVPYQRKIPLFVTWNNGQVELLKKEKHQSYVYSKYLRRKFWVENEFIEEKNGNYKATDYTNYEIPLKKDELVKLVTIYQDKAQIKKNGILGWTYLSNLDLE